MRCIVPSWAGRNRRGSACETQKGARDGPGRSRIRAMDGVTIVFVAVVGARFVVPLAIPLYPLPAIIAALVLDAADQSIFQAFGYDPPGYQSYDKAMDVFYLAVAYLATMRNWQALPAYAVGRFLYFYRLVGVVAFELTQTRALLLVFPNTFEYFFIAYEGIRTRWAPVVYKLRWWVVTAAVHLDLHQAPAGVVDPRRAARLHRVRRRPLVGHSAAGRAVRGGGAGLLVRDPAPAAARRPPLAVRGRPAARGDGHRRRDGRAWHATYGALRSTATRREDRPAGPDLGDLRADPSRCPGVQHRAVHRCRGRRRRQRRARRCTSRGGRSAIEIALALFGARLAVQHRVRRSWRTGCSARRRATSTRATPSSS